jgi:MFS family permease
MASRRTIVISTLGITQTLSWASSYYLTAIFADPVSADLHISRSFFFGVVSAALLASGLLGPMAGRMIDRHGGRDVLALTNLAFAAGLAIMAFAQGPAILILAWTAIAIGMGFGLYEAAFATATGLYGQAARNAITGITLIAGFASTVGWPTSRFLVETVGWRDAALVWAALHVFLGLPMNRFIIPKATAAPPRPQAAPPQAGRINRTMIILAGVFGVTWFISASLAAHLPRLLQAMGATPEAAVAASALVGPAQVVARLFEFSVLRRVSPMFSARLSTILNPIGAIGLAIFGPVAAVPFVLLHGAGNGMLTIARGTLPLALFGPEGYGLRTGLLAAPARITQGAAPLVFGLVLDRGGPTAALMFCVALMGASCFILCLLHPRT